MILFSFNSVRADINFSEIESKDKVVISGKPKINELKIRTRSVLVDNSHLTKRSRSSENIQLIKSQKSTVNLINDSSRIKLDPRKETSQKVEGYITTTDEKGNETSDYVYGELQKSKSGTTGYLYGDKDKSYYVYGHEQDGQLQVEKDTGAVVIDKKKIPQKKEEDKF